MIHIIKTVVAVLFAILLTLGAVYNRETMDISLGPLGNIFSAPLYILLYGALFAGFFLGVGYGWLHYGPVGKWSRHRAREKKEKIRQAQVIVEEAEKYQTTQREDDTLDGKDLTVRD